MGFSGVKGTVTVGSGNTALTAEVIKWDATPSVYKKEYGHDKSAGWQDLCYGTKRVEGTVEVKLRGGLDLGPAQIVLLKLWPYGTAVGWLGGYAGIDSTPLSVVVENGDVVSATYKFSSKGTWLGLPNDGALWGGFETDTGGGIGGLNLTGSGTSGSSGSAGDLFGFSSGQ